jgi:hypothetical protein
MKAHHLWLAIAGLSLLATPAPATVHYVNVNNASPGSPYTNWATAATDIQSAVDAALAGDVVLVTNGIYQTGGRLFSDTTTNRLAVDKAITIKSVNGPAVTIIRGYQVPGTTNGASSVRCVYLVSGATLSGFTLTNGSTTGNGGGIHCDNSSALVSNCIITGNSAGGSGGGGSGWATFLNCLIRGNTAFTNGGGLCWGWATNCLIVGNSAQKGGGTYLVDLLYNCTISGNTASVSYGGVGSGVHMYNCIVYYNTAPVSSNHSAKMDHCCTVPIDYSIYSFTNEPRFVDPAAGNFRLQSNSPCINAGNNAYVRSSTDLDGKPRIMGGTVEIGAYEFPVPGIRYVNLGNTNPVPPYSSWPAAATNIQDAIDAAIAGDFIVVSNGIYQTGGRVVFGTMTNRVVIDKAVTVQSVNGPAATVIAGLPGTGGYPSTGYRCVYLTNGAALIGFTLTNGATRTSGDITNEQSGGGIWCESISATISNCVLTRNYANQQGGAVFQGTLNNCIITNNQAFISGGGACLANLNNCTVSSNKLIQGTGGGGAAFGVLSNCLIIWNFAPGYGGGTYYSTVNNCVVSNNSARFGGGVSFGVANHSLISSNRTSSSGYGGGAYSNVLVNCVLKNNLATAGGGGTYYCILLNCTVVSNTAGSWGGGVYGNGTLTNCIVYHNSAPKVPDYPDDARYTLNYCDVMPLATNGVGNITNEPAFADLANGDFRLQTNSPCINAGDNASAPGGTDLDGNPRIVGGTVDIGAYECQSPALLACYAWLQNYGLPTDAADVYTDSDGDGLNNWQEWHTGTIPTNALSLLKMTAVANDISGMTVTWQSVSGKTYFLQRSDNLAAQPAFSTIQSNIAGQAGTTSWLDPGAAGAGPFFYRVGVQ